MNGGDDVGTFGVTVGVGVMVAVGVAVQLGHGVGVMAGVPVAVLVLVGLTVAVAVRVEVGVDELVAVGETTVIVPTMPMDWWKVQWYLNVPSELNVNLKVPPGLTVPESHTPVSEVVVCGVPGGGVVALFVHVTVVPTRIVIGSGLKEKLTIDTPCAEAGLSFAAVFPVPPMVRTIRPIVSGTPRRYDSRIRISPHLSPE